MKLGIVIAVAAAVILGAGAYAIYGVDDKPQAALDTRLENNVNGLFGKITAQTTGTPSNPQKSAGITGRMQSFEGNANLFEFYTRNKDSTDPTVVYQAYRAFSTCQAMQANATNLRNSLAQTDVQPPMSTERRGATEELLRRCQGFDRYSEREWNDTAVSLRDRARQLGSVEAKLDLTNPDTAVDVETMIALLQSNSNTAYERATPTLSSMLKNAMKVTPDTSDSQHIDFAVYLAACDLGRDCSENAWPVVMQCAYDNYCQKPLSKIWQENLSAADIKHVQEIKEKILTMLKTNQYSLLKPG